MSFGRWLLTHSLSLFLAVMLLAAWFWRDELELDRAWAQLRQQAALGESSARETPDKPVSRRSGEDKKGSPPSRKATESGSNARSGVDADAFDDDNAAASSSRTGEAGGNPPAQAAAPSAASPQPDTTAKRLQAARKAFWSRDFDQAISLYRQLIADHPGNPDYIGELGNIYYNLNRFDDAAEMFLRAGRLLVEQGEAQRARLLLPALMSLDRSRGEQLEKLLKASAKPAS